MPAPEPTEVVHRLGDAVHARDGDRIVPPLGTDPRWPTDVTGRAL